MTIDCKISKEVWTGQQCDYSNLRVFGCEAYALIPKNQCSKLDPKSRKLIFVGYGDGVKGYRLWNPTVHKIIINWDVTFNELSLSNLDVSNDLKQANVPQFQQVQFDTQSSTKGNHEDVQEEDIHVDTPQEEDDEQI